MKKFYRKSRQIAITEFLHDGHLQPIIVCMRIRSTHKANLEEKYIFSFSKQQIQKKLRNFCAAATYSPTTSVCMRIGSTNKTNLEENKFKTIISKQKTLKTNSTKKFYKKSKQIAITEFLRADLPANLPVSA